MEIGSLAASDLCLDVLGSRDRPLQVIWVVSVVKILIIHVGNSKQVLEDTKHCTIMPHSCICSISPRSNPSLSLALADMFYYPFLHLFCPFRLFGELTRNGGLNMAETAHFSTGIGLRIPDDQIAWPLSYRVDSSWVHSHLNSAHSPIIHAMLSIAVVPRMGFSIADQ